MIGRQIGSYQITAKLGEGGMGEVYRARDSKLKREVAIKVLPADVANDRERLARFQREAEVLASLNHPHIAHVYGIEDNALVMELVEGEDLSQRIARGRIPIDEALAIAKQIAEALEAAHDAGIVHRDLKPANVKVRTDGTVKVLDFGLAKAYGQDLETPGRSGLANSPTITSPAMTVRGVILGTAAYMSPEQAKGKVVDKRADIWAFGCVIFEMLTSKRAFEGDGVAETFAAIITKEPDWSMLPVATPASVRRVLHRALHKDLKHRLRDIGDGRIDFDDISAAEPSAPRAQRLPILSAAMLIASIAAVAIAANVARSNQSGGMPTTTARFIIPLPEGATVNSVAISRSGELIAYEREDTAAAGNSAETQLFVHRLAQFDSTPISNTSGAHHPFFSPDGAWIGFFSHGQLLRVRSGGGTPQVICETPLGWGATWADDDTITFASPSSSTIARALHSVSALGGTITDLLPPISGAASGRWPTVFPHRPEIVFSAFTTNRDNQARLDIRKADGSIQTLAERGTGARLVSTGQLAWARDGRLFVSPFDAQQLALTGSPVPVVDDLSVDAFSGMARFDVSLDGTLVYVAGGVDGNERELVIGDATGHLSKLPIQPRMFEQPAIAPDGHRFVVRTMEGGQNSGLWVGDLAKPALMRLTITQGEPESPVWSPDGTRVAFNANDSTTSSQRLFVKSADDAGPTRAIWQPPNHAHVGDWAPNGNLLIAMVSDPQSLGDLWTVPLNGDAAAPWLNTTFSEREPRFSPDGRWIAYTSNESGRDEVYARPFPGPGGKVQVSTNGGGQALWARDGTTVVYRQGTSFMRAAVHAGSALGVEAPTEMFAGDFDSGPVAGQTSYGLAPDGSHLLLVRPLQAATKRSLRVVVHWAQSLVLTASARPSGGK